MFHHTVLLRLAADADEPFFAGVREREATVRATCSGVLAFRILPNTARTAKGFGHALFSVFEDEAAFRAYDVSQAHADLSAWLRPRLEDLVVADGTLDP